jgi:hypothetical protein
MKPMKTSPDFSRMNAYSTPLPEGGVEIDAEGMAVDLIVALKMAGCPREEFLRKMAELWGEIEVDVVASPRGGD